jgi:hypothetical protein
MPFFNFSRHLCVSLLLAVTIYAFKLKPFGHQGLRNIPHHQLRSHPTSRNPSPSFKLVAQSSSMLAVYAKHLYSIVDPSLLGGLLAGGLHAITGKLLF